MIHVNQERYLLAERASYYSFFIGVWYQFEGRIDVPRLKESASKALARHPAFRTAFDVTPEGIVPIVSDSASFRFEYRTVPNLASQTIDTTLSSVLTKVSDTTDPGTFHRIVLLDGPGDTGALVFAQHHAVSDGVSLDIFIEEVGAIYSGAAASLPPAQSFYSEMPGETGTERDFWKNYASGLEQVPRFHRNMQAAAARPDVMRFDIETGKLLQAPEESTVFSLLGAAYATQIARQTAHPDVLISIQSAGRHGMGSKRILGPFSNAVPLRIAVDETERMSDLARRFRKETKNVLRHERLGYQNILSTMERAPDFALNFYPDPPPVRFEGLALGPRQLLRSESDYALNLRWHRRAEGQLCADAYFDAAEIEADRIEAFVRRALRIAASASDHQDDTVGEILNRTRSTRTSSSLKTQVTSERIYDRFARAAGRHKARVAIHHSAGNITYGGLLARVEAKAERLIAAGLRPGYRVGVLGERDIELVENLLALSRLGICFAVLDAAYPDARLQTLSESFRPNAAIVPENCADRQGLFTASGIDVVLSSAASGGPSASIPQVPAPGQDEIAYVLFTSGTTGTPKTISVGHQALPDFLDWQATHFQIDETDRVSLLSGLAHDPMLRDVFLPLGLGATLVIPEPDALTDPRRLAEWLRDVRPTVIHTTPPMGQLLSNVSGGAPDLPEARFVFWGGDALPGTLVRATQIANPNLLQVNFYGATETPQAVLFHECGDTTDPWQVMPIGTARPGLQAHLRGQTGEPCDVNEIGELHITTPYLVRIGTGDGQTAGASYGTGDLGYRRPDGNIQLVGRRDDQVSVRGYRIELSAVERHLLEIEGIKAAAVLTFFDPSGQTALVAHIAHDGLLEDADLRRSLAKIVPAYSIPARFVRHKALPLLPNGKRDRQALRTAQENFYESTALHTKRAAKMDSKETRIADIYAAVLGHPVIDPSLSFVDLGADSLNTLQAELRLEGILSTKPDDWAERPIAKLASMIPADSIPHTRKSIFSPIRTDPAVLLRAAAILIVVMLHYRIASIGGGATFILFFLSGVSFARYQIPRVLREQSARSILDTVGKVMIATFPIVLVIQVVKAVQGEPFNPASILFYTNFLDFSQPDSVRSATIWLWFIACYVQLMLLFAAALALPSIRSTLERTSVRFLLWCFAIGVTLKFSLPALFDADLILEGVPTLSYWNYLPTTHAPTVLLGMLVLRAREGALSRLVCVFLIVTYAIAVGAVFSHNRPEMFMVAALIVLWGRQIPIPQFLYRLASEISRTSLYIYLVHMPLLSALTIAGVLLWPPITLVLAVAVSIFYGALIDRAHILLSRLHYIQVSTGKKPDET